jgi:hypothetical protein
MATDIKLENKPKKKSASRKRSRKSSVKKSPKENVVVIKRVPADEDHLISISKSVGTASVIMTALVVAITPSNVWVLGPVIGAMCIFGIAMSYFATK